MGSPKLEFAPGYVLFTPLIEELNQIQNVGFKKTSSLHTFKRGKLIPNLLCGDNLGLNSILGFSEGFNATFFCRFCKSPKGITQSQYMDNIQV